MAEPRDQRPILPPPPADLTEQSRQAEESARAEREAAAAKEAERQAKADERERARQERQAAKDAKAVERQRAKEVQAELKDREQRAAEKKAAEKKAAQETAAQETAQKKAAEQRSREQAGADQTASLPAVPPDDRRRGKSSAPRRQRRAQLRLVQVDAWSVMKTSFLLSIALGIVLVVAVAIIWAVLGAAGVWDSINSIVQQAVGSQDGPQFDVTDYVGTSRVLGITMVVAALDVILITAMATLGAFLYNLSAALLGGIEVTLAEDN